MASVTVNLSIPIQVIQALTEHGYVPANYDGFNGPDESGTQVGILYDDPQSKSETRRIMFFWTREVAPPKRFLGLIKHNGSTAERWTIEVYGQTWLDRITDLANELSKLFGVDITVTLVSAENRFSVKPKYEHGYV